MTSRAEAFSLWMTSPMPMVTLTKLINVSRIAKLSKRHNRKFNALLCWAIGKAASQMEIFYTLPEQGKLYKYDNIAINVIVNNKNGGINSCDIPFYDNVEKFLETYNTLTVAVKEACQSSFLEESMIVGTSAMVQTELECIVNQYTDKFCNPMVMWGKYRKSWFRTTLPISFQFHHVQMDGGHGAAFLELLQKEIEQLQL
jgi:chloramphenicol O-acetyltransferase type A